MDIENFHRQIRDRVQEDEVKQQADEDMPLPSPEAIFADIVMETLQSAGIVDDYKICNWSGRLGRARLRISGYASSSDGSRLDILVTHYLGTAELQPVSNAETIKFVRSAMKFVEKSARGELLDKLDPTNDIYELAELIQRRWHDHPDETELTEVRVLFLTDGQTKANHFKGDDVSGKSVQVEAIDIVRLYKHMSGSAREEIAICFLHAMNNIPLPCVHVNDPDADYEYALAAMPGELIRALYDRHTTRLLEANVRTFLGGRGKVNKRIANTLRTDPDHFMAYNNGLVIVCDEAKIVSDSNGVVGISHLSGIQIVNGGQTTSSLYFSKRDQSTIDLSRVRVPVKIIIPKDKQEDSREKLVSNISRYANSQNAVKDSDLSANRAFHVQLEQIARRQWCPDGISQWFYERAAGSYNVTLTHVGTTPARRRKFKEQNPTNKKLKKNEVASIHEAWRQLPAQVALAGEKNFARFMSALDETPTIVPDPLNESWYKAFIGKVIIFRTIQRLIKTGDAKATFRQSQINISTYTLSVVANRLGDDIDFNLIWRQQSLSSDFEKLLLSWATTVNDAFTNISKGRQFSEVAKRPDLWNHIRSADYSLPDSNTPELIQDTDNIFTDDLKVGNAM